MEKKSICWITLDCFIDVDLPVIPRLLSNYRIHWFVILGRNSRFSESHFEPYFNMTGLAVEFIHFNGRQRDFKTVLDYISLAKKIKRINCLEYYCDLVPSTPFSIPFFFSLPRNKTIFAAHDGNVKASFKFAFLSRISFFLCYGLHSKYIQMFSNSQAELLKSSYKYKCLHVIPLMLKDFGPSLKRPQNGILKFLLFGTLHEDKNLGVLIKAAELLYERTDKPFVVSINGLCPDDWEKKYGCHIKHPELFDMNIRQLANEEIPDLFAGSDYVVYPYSRMSQSGALKVAYNYRKPVIVSDLDGFKEEVEEGVNGFFFKSGDAKELCSVMLRCLEMSPEERMKLNASVERFIESRYSDNSIVAKYVDMFENISTIKID